MTRSSLGLRADALYISPQFLTYRTSAAAAAARNSLSQKMFQLLWTWKKKQKWKNEKIVLNILSLSLYNLVCRDGLCLVFSPGWRDSPHTEPQRSNCALYTSRLICDSNMYKGNLLLWIFISFAFASYAQSTDTTRQLERENWILNSYKKMKTRGFHLLWRCV